MFAAHYFGPRYFAPRYFAKVGGVNTNPVPGRAAVVITGSKQAAKTEVTQ